MTRVGRVLLILGVAFASSCTDSPTEPPNVAGEYLAVLANGEPLPLSPGPSDWCTQQPNWRELSRVELTLGSNGRYEIFVVRAAQCGAGTGSGGGISLMGTFEARPNRDLVMTSVFDHFFGRFDDGRVLEDGRIEMRFSEAPLLGQPWFELTFERGRRGL